MDSVTLTLTKSEAATLDLMAEHQRRCPTCSRPRTLPRSTPACAVGLLRLQSAAKVIRAHADQFAALFPTTGRNTR